MATAALVPSRGVLVAGKYLLRRPLASGGMGSVWVARHQRLDIDVAIKFMDPSLASSQELRVRFEREARAAAKLKTNHVVQILDHGVDRELPYIAMELLEGEDLSHRLKRVGRLEMNDTVSICEQIAKGLSQAHAADIIHRDLKPANVFLTRIDDAEMVKLLDFGVAKMPSGADGGDSTRTGVVVGSPNYMSPEQARSTKADHRADLWSLGVILFRCLTGVNPFRGETNADVIVKVCADPIPSASSVAPDMPPAIDAFFERALERSPEGRFQSAAELASAFARSVLVAQAEAPTVAERDLAHPRSAPSDGTGQQPVVRRAATTVVETSDTAPTTPDWGALPLNETDVPIDLSESLTPGSLARVSGRPELPNETGGTLSSIGTLTRWRSPDRPRALILSALAIGALVVGGVAAALSLAGASGSGPSVAELVRSFVSAEVDRLAPAAVPYERDATAPPSSADAEPSVSSSDGAPLPSASGSAAPSRRKDASVRPGSAPPPPSGKSKPPSWGF